MTTETRPRCIDCGGPRSKHSLARCLRCHNARPLTRSIRPPTPRAQLWNLGTGPKPSLPPYVPPDDGIHRHRFSLPSVSDGDGLYVGRCECGAIKEHRPFADEDAARNRVTQRMTK